MATETAAGARVDPEDEIVLVGPGLVVRVWRSKKPEAEYFVSRAAILRVSRSFGEAWNETPSPLHSHEAEGVVFVCELPSE